MVTEMSTVLLHFHAFLTICGMEKGKLALLNGVIFLLAFTHRIGKIHDPTKATKNQNQNTSKTQLMSCIQVCLFGIYIGSSSSRGI